MTTQSPDEGVRDLYTIPSSSGWFQWDQIHETERRSLPEFFNGGSISRNPKVYKDYRDFIINKYREDPSRRLTFTEVRKSLVADVGSLHKLFLFLDRCGFINFGSGAPKLIDGGVAGGGPLVVLEERASAGVEVVPAPSITSTQAPSSGSAENGLFKLPPLTSYSDVFGDSMRGPVCGSCGDQCVSGPDESMEEGGFVKCVKCFENRKEVSADENLKDNSDDGGSHVNSAWTDAETLLLLEAVLKHGDDWDLIAQHVRTKDKFDCIARLVQLPFSENSGKRDNRHSNSHSTDKVTFDEQHDKENVVDDTTPVHPPKRRCFPSSLDATGSLMKQVAFLSTVGGPEVASVAAEAAVTALCNENPCAVKAFLTGEGEGTTNVELTSTNNDRESLIKVEDWNTESHKLTVTDDKHGSVPEKNFVDMAFRIRAAIATALGAAAARAKLMADHEEREMEHLMASIIESQVRKVQYKMKHFEELEVIMEEELAKIQMMEEPILEEWVSVLQWAIHEGIIPRWERPNILC